MRKSWTPAPQPDSPRKVDLTVLSAAADAFNERHPKGTVVRIYDQPASAAITDRMTARTGAIFSGKNSHRIVVYPGAHILEGAVVVAVNGASGPEFVDIKRVKWSA